jgi:hypothetical protein
MENKTNKKTPMQFVLNSLPQKSLGDLSDLLLKIEKESRKNDLLNMMQKIFQHCNSSSENDISNFDFEKYIEENT